MPFQSCAKVDTFLPYGKFSSLPLCLEQVADFLALLLRVIRMGKEKVCSMPLCCSAFFAHTYCFIQGHVKWVAHLAFGFERTKLSPSLASSSSDMSILASECPTDLTHKNVMLKYIFRSTTTGHLICMSASSSRCHWFILSALRQVRWH